MKNFRILTLLGVMFALAGCFEEDYSFCPPVDPPVPPVEANVRLVVKTDYEAEGKGTRGAAELGWYDDQIESVTVFVFDEDGGYVTSWEGDEYTMGAEYVVPLVLPEGHTYRYVAWTNHNRAEYEFSHALEDLHSGLTIEDLTANLVVPASGVFTEDIPHRHYGTKTGQAVFDQSAVVDHEIVISPHTYKINYIVRGLPADRQYGVSAVDYNTRHSHDNCSHVSDATQTYSHRRTLTAGGATRAEEVSEISASVIQLQIGDDTGTNFELTDSDGNVIYPAAGNTAHENDILDIIRASTPNKDGVPGLSIPELMTLLDNKYEYDIIVTFTGGDPDDPNGYKDVSVEASVPNWNPIDVKPDLD